MPSSYTLGPHFENFVKTLVHSGRYASASEVMRDSLRLMEEREQIRQTKLEALRTEIREGLNSGPSELLMMSSRDFSASGFPSRAALRLFMYVW